MSLLFPFRKKKFSKGLNSYLTLDNQTMMSFDVLILEEHDTYTIETNNQETAVLLIQGSTTCTFHNEAYVAERKNWIKENPVVFHLSKEEHLHIKSNTPSRFAIIKTNNSESFPSKIYNRKDIQTEHRGKDILQGTCYRHVRLAFDQTITHPNANLVLGEVLNFPGCWSSYPPHHHPQPEIYYYEFDPHQGYGHGELGEQVYKIKDKDLLMITDNRDHSQTAAPGYHLYYIWAIRHLENNPYKGFTFTKPHDKLLSFSE